MPIQIWNQHLKFSPHTKFQSNPSRNEKFALWGINDKYVNCETKDTVPLFFCNTTSKWFAVGKWSFQGVKFYIDGQTAYKNVSFVQKCKCCFRFGISPKNLLSGLNLGQIRSKMRNSKISRDTWAWNKRWSRNLFGAYWFVRSHES